MTDTADGEDRLRRRARRLGEAFAGEESPTVVALLADAGEPGASWRGAAALGDASAAQRRTLLVNLAGPGSGLDRFLGVDGREGLEAVRSGDRALSEAAVHPPDRDFLYLPSGDAGPGDRPRPTEDRGFLRALGRLAGRVREARGLLLLYLEAGALPEALAEELVEAAVPLAGAAPHLPAGVPVLGRMADEPEEPEAGSTPEEAEGGDDDGPEATGPDVPPPWVESEEPGAAADETSADGDEPDRSGWRRHRRRAGPPWGKIAAGAAVVLLLAGGWWWLADRSTAGEAAAGEPAGTAVAGAGAGAGPDSARDGDSAGTDAGAPSIDSAAGSGASSGAAAGSASSAPSDPSAASASPAGVAASAPELPHSVLVASYSSWPAARERAERLRAGEGGTWVVAPTPVRGSIYWRLYAGAEADEDAARRLMERLVERGVKDEARGWDVRPVSLTYRVATLPDRAGAEERAAGLRDRGIPAFVLTAAAAGDTVWQVCAGAFESRRAARAAGEMLEAEGVEAELVTRRGEGDGT